MTDYSYNIKTDKSFLNDVGQFIQHHRLNQNKSQEQVSSAAGISRSTLSLLERGEVVRLDTLLQVLRVLDLLYVMEVFQVDQQISPVAYAKMKKKQRQRASPNNEVNEPPLEW